MNDYIVYFIKGTYLQKNVENVIFNRSNIPIPRVGDLIQFPNKYWNQTGSNRYIVKDVIFQYQDENGATFVWILCDICS